MAKKTHVKVRLVPEEKPEKELNLVDKKNIKNKLNKISNLLKEIKNLK